MADPVTQVATSFFLGRQPILDRHGEIHGYELLFRAGRENSASDMDDDYHATVQVIARAWGELGIRSVVGDALGFVNLDTRLLTSGIVDVLPVESVVLEILESTQLNDETVAICIDLHNKGYRLALDDMIALRPEHQPLLPHVDYIKVDVQELDEAALRALVVQLMPLKITLVAEKVETRPQYDLCVELGFMYFQGYYFAHPEVLSGKAIDPAQQQMLRLVQLLQGDADDARVESVFKEDPKLTYNLLRLVNSVAMGMRTQIHSVQHAMSLLGRKQLLRWVSLLIFAHRGGSKFPDPLAIMAACRGRFMELLAKSLGGDLVLTDQAFMTGMMSLLEPALEVPLNKIVEELQMAQPIRHALMERSGRLGDLLCIIECVERCDAVCLTEKLKQAGATLEQVTKAEIAAMTWANAIGK